MTLPDPRRLHVVTMPTSLPAACTGGYTCSCEPCALERLAPRARGDLADQALPVRRRPSLERAA